MQLDLQQRVKFILEIASTLKYLVIVPSYTTGEGCFCACGDLLRAAIYRVGNHISNTPLPPSPVGTCASRLLEARRRVGERDEICNPKMFPICDFHPLHLL